MHLQFVHSFFKILRYNGLIEQGSDHKEVIKMFNKLKSDKLMRMVIKEPKNQSLIFERIADDFFKPNLSGEFQVKSFDVDILEDEETYYLLADLPGCRHRDLDIHFEHQYLTIEAHRYANQSFEDTTCIRKERAIGHLIRRFLIEGVCFEAMTYKIEDGQLVLTLPKVQIK